MSKSLLRKSMISLRKQLSTNEVLAKSTTIINHIKTDIHYQNAQLIALFYPMGQEVNLLALITDQKRFCFPRVEKDGIHFYETTDFDSFVKSSFGVLEPTKGHLCDDAIDYMLVPALAIADNHYRIGYGKGYYDQFLINHRPPHVVGVIYDFQRVKSFEVSDYDQVVDRIIWG